MRYALAVGLMVLAGLAGCHQKNKDMQMSAEESPGTSLEDLSAAPAPEEAPAATVVPPTYQPAPAPAPVYTPPAAASAAQTYLVQPKDTLWSIATRELGSGKRWREIADVNPGLTPQNLKAGQTINLPAK